MIHLIDWSLVTKEVTITHILTGTVLYIVIHGTIKSLKFLVLLAKGALLSDTKRAILYIHARNKHPAKVGECIVGDCIHVSKELRPGKEHQYA